mgnify:FL=1
MKKRIHLKRKFSFFEKKINFVIFIVIILIIMIVLTLNFISLKVNPVLLDYAQMEARKIASIIINDAVNQNITNDIDIEELFIITRDTNNEVKTIDFNPIIVNQILTETTILVQSNLRYLEQGKVDMLNLMNNALIDYNQDKLKQGIIYEIPSGVIFGNSFLANIGPKIPVKFSLVGDIVGYINTNVTDYGINNALIEVNIVLELSEQVILPFVSEKITIDTTIPVALKLIQGSVPNYYLNGLNSPSFALPIN